MAKIYLIPANFPSFSHLFSGIYSQYHEHFKQLVFFPLLMMRSADNVINALGGDVKLISGRDVSLYGANISVVGNGGGNIIIDAQNINTYGSFLLAGIIENTGNPENQGGDIKLNARETIAIDRSAIINSVFWGAEGNAGKVLIQANGAVSVSGDSGIFNSIGLGLNTGGGFAVGTVGGIALQADSLSLTEGSELVASTQGEGNAGTMEIDVRGLTSLLLQDAADYLGIPTNHCGDMR